MTFFQPYPKEKRVYNPELRAKMRTLPCVVCGRHPPRRPDPEWWQIIDCEHFIPWSVGPGDTEENLNPICRPCHTRKGKMGFRPFWRAYKARITRFRAIFGLVPMSDEFIARLERK